MCGAKPATGWYDSIRQGGVWLAVLLMSQVLSAEPARADVVLVTSPGQLQPDAVFSWGGFGPQGTFVPNGSTMPVPGLPGQFVTVFGNIDGGFLRVDQGGLWSGSFPSGDQLLSTHPFPGSFIDKSAALNFSDTIGGFGAFIQMDPDRGIALGDPSFTAFITGTDINHEVILGGGSVLSPDGSAIFIGVRDNGSTFPPLRGIELRINDSQGFTWDFAFDPIVQAAPGPGPAAVATPEPSGVLLWGLSAVGLFGYRRFRRPCNSADFERSTSQL